MEITNKKVVVLAEQLYDERELWYPYYRLKEAGAEVTLVGSGNSDTFHSKVGMPVTVDTSADRVSAAGYDGVVIPGGYAPDHMRRHPAMVKLVKDLYGAGKIVSAICHAGWMLSSAGIVRGKSLTSFFAIKDDLVNAGANWVDQEVVVDGNLITSRTPDDLPAFMKAVIESLAKGI